ncbi:hypothetical protein [Mesorhizobium sp. CN2-181]|uniref:hypothetical protein n=1 Tax=Mesorhizobium yinganensis TaxID=3157707 RepID=UPI0032B7C711
MMLHDPMTIAGADSSDQLFATMKLWTLRFIEGLKRLPSEREALILWASVQRAGGVPEACIEPQEHRHLTIQQMGAIDIRLSDDGRTVIFDRHMHPDVNSTYRATLPMPTTITSTGLLRIDEFASVLPHLSWRPVVNT